MADPIEARQEIIKQMLKKTEKPSPLPNLNYTQNRTVFSAYRVVVYRMELNKPAVFPINGRNEDSNYILSLDTIERGYRRISDWLRTNCRKEWPKFVKSLYSAIKEEYEKAVKGDIIENSMKDNFKGKALVKEYDITPLVTNVNITQSLEDANAAAITMIDPAFIDFSTKELNRIYSLNPWLSQTAYNKEYKNTLSTLKKFRIREYDLVRVYIYSGDMPLSKRISDVKNTLFIKDKKGNDNSGDVGKLIAEYCMRPAFTGFAASIGNTNTVDAVANATVSCIGVSRILSQSTMVVDKALADKIIIQAPESAGSSTPAKGQMAMTSKLYDGMSSLAVFVDIMEKYFMPHVVCQDRYNGKNWAFGKPNLKRLIDNLTKDNVLVPNLPGVVCLHNVKEKFREHMFLCDDAMDYGYFMLSSINNTTPLKVDPRELYGTLTSYLYMLKNSFSLFDSTYESAWNIFNDIRTNCFMEIFEDRTGSFRFRFPRYNKCTLDQYFQPKDIISGSLTRSDSNNFSVVQVMPQAPILGSNWPLIPDVYVDPLSVFRYGLRVTGDIQNPNALVPQVSASLGRFMRFYHANKESRTATLNVVGDPSVEVGQMVGFNMGYRTNVDTLGEENRLQQDKGKDEGTLSSRYVGYVATISETIGIDTLYTQQLDLQFVRAARIYGVRNPATDTIKVATVGEVFSNPRKTVFSDIDRRIYNVLYPVISTASDLALNNKFIPREKSSPTDKEYNPDRDDTILQVPVHNTNIAVFEYIDSAIDLASDLLPYMNEIDKQNLENEKRLRDLKPSAENNKAVWNMRQECIENAKVVMTKLARVVAETFWIEDLYPDFAVWVGNQRFANVSGQVGRVADLREEARRAAIEAVSAGMKKYDPLDYKDKAFEQYKTAIVNGKTTDPVKVISAKIDADDNFNKMEIDGSKLNIPDFFKDYFGSTHYLTVLRKDMSFSGASLFSQVTDSYKELFKDSGDNFTVEERAAKTWGAIVALVPPPGAGLYVSSMTVANDNSKDLEAAMWTFWGFWARVEESVKKIRLNKLEEIHALEEKLFALDRNRVDIEKRYEDMQKELAESSKAKE